MSCERNCTNFYLMENTKLDNFLIDFFLALDKSCLFEK